MRKYKRPPHGKYTPIRRLQESKEVGISTLEVEIKGMGWLKVGKDEVAKNNVTGILAALDPYSIKRHKKRKATA